MSINFAETMRGWLSEPGGQAHPASFEVRALGEGGGKFRLRGVISAPPLCAEAPCEGSLVISVVPSSIAYRLEFVGVGGKRYVLEAAKHPTPLSPLRSMTEMGTTVRDEAGAVVALGQMTFDLRDLPSFAASWLPLPQSATRLLDARRRAAERRLLAGT